MDVFGERWCRMLGDGLFIEMGKPHLMEGRSLYSKRLRRSNCRWLMEYALGSCEVTLL